MNHTDLINLTVKQLQALYLQTIGQPSTTRNKPWLIKKLTAHDGSGLSAPKEPEQEQRRKPAKKGKAKEKKPRKEVSAPLAESPVAPASHLATGTVIEKTYKGRTITLTVCAEGYDLDGTIYKSLSAAAKDITGCNWNGHVFFGLKKRKALGGAKA